MLEAVRETEYAARRYRTVYTQDAIKERCRFIYNVSFTEDLRIMSPRGLATLWLCTGSFTVHIHIACNFIKVACVYDIVHGLFRTL